MYLSKQELRYYAGKLIFCGFTGETLTAELKEILRTINPLGLIMFSRNITAPKQICEFNYEIKQFFTDLTGENLLIGVDQEGGRVARIKAPATIWPPLRTLGQLNSAELTYQLAQGLGAELRALNFDIDFAPVLDVDSNPQNPVIGDRAFSNNPAVVAKLGTAFIQGLQAAGIAPCGKHFPGHGDTNVDSHQELPYIDHERQRLRAVEWPPFKAAIEAGLDALMSAHIVVRSLDEQYPATLSPKILQTILREEWHFSGVIFTDDLEMKAMTPHYSPQQITEHGLKAGIDIFLACKTPELIFALYEAILKNLEKGLISPKLLKTSAQRVLAWREKYQHPIYSKQTSAARHNHLQKILAANALLQQQVARQLGVA